MLYSLTASPFPIPIFTLWNNEYQKGSEIVYLFLNAAQLFFFRFPDGVKLVVPCEIVDNVSVVVIGFLYG